MAYVELLRTLAVIIIGFFVYRKFKKPIDEQTKAIFSNLKKATNFIVKKYKDQKKKEDEQKKVISN